MKWEIVDGGISNGKDTFKNLAFIIDFGAGRIDKFGEFEDMHNTLSKMKSLCCDIDLFVVADDLDVIDISGGRGVEYACRLANELCSCNTGSEMIRICDEFEVRRN